MKADTHYDRRFVLRTNLDLLASDVALRYKELWRVGRLFRDIKSLLSTRPIFHHDDATICGHVFASFLALILLHELECRMEAHSALRRFSYLSILSSKSMSD